MQDMGDGHPVILDKGGSGKQEYRPRIPLCDRHLLFQLFRMPQIVAVQKRDPLAFCLPDTIVARRGGTGIFRILKNSDPWILFGQLLHDTPRMVFRAVVDDQQLPVLPGLPQDALDFFA